MLMIDIDFVRFAAKLQRVLRRIMLPREVHRKVVTKMLRSPGTTPVQCCASQYRLELRAAFTKRSVSLCTARVGKRVLGVLKCDSNVVASETLGMHNPVAETLSFFYSSCGDMRFNLWNLA